MRTSPSRQEGPLPQPTPPPLVDRAVTQPRACRGILICPRCRTRIHREGVCVSDVGVLFSYFAQPKGGDHAMVRSQDLHVVTIIFETLSLLDDHIHDIDHALSCIIPLSRLCDFIIRDYSKYCFSFIAFGVRKTKYKLRVLTYLLQRLIHEPLSRAEIVF